MAPDDDYMGRLAIAMGSKDGSRPDSSKLHQLAKALGVTYQAVAKFWTGKSQALSARNNALAAREFDVNPDWLVLGDCEKARPEAVAPDGPVAGLALRLANAYAQATAKLDEAAQLGLYNHLAGEMRNWRRKGDASEEVPAPHPEPTSSPQAGPQKRRAEVRGG